MFFFYIPVAFPRYHKPSCFENFNNNVLLAASIAKLQNKEILNVLVSNTHVRSGQSRNLQASDGNLYFYCSYLNEHASPLPSQM